MATEPEADQTASAAGPPGEAKRILPAGTVPAGGGPEASADAPVNPAGPPENSSPVPDGRSPDGGVSNPAEAAPSTAAKPGASADESPTPTTEAADEYSDGSPYSAYGYDSSTYPDYTPYPGEENPSATSDATDSANATTDAPDTAAASATTESHGSADSTSDGDDEEGGGPIKPFLEHLEDLRWTLVRSVSAVIIGMLACLVGANYLITFLMWPLHLSESFFQRNRTDVAIVAGTNVIARVMPEQFGGTNLWGTNHLGSLHLVPITVGTNTLLALQPHFGKSDVPPPSMLVIKNYGPIEGIMVALKLALYGGLVLSSPFVFYFVGAFVLPALHVHEKKILYQAVAYGTGLFVLGVVFCYFVVMVLAIGATVEFSKWLGFGADEWRADAYIGFVVKFMLGMGLTFELPVVILVLVKIGILDYDKLKGFRQWAIVGNLVLAAFVTPSGDPITMLAMAIPLQLLYEISVAVAWYWERKERRKARIAQA